MLIEIKQIISQRIVEIKTFILWMLTSFSSWYALNYSEIITTLTEIASFAAFVLLFIYNLLNTKKIKLENKNIALDIKIKQKQWDEANNK